MFSQTRNDKPFGNLTQEYKQDFCKAVLSKRRHYPLIQTVCVLFHGAAVYVVDMELFSLGPGVLAFAGILGRISMVLFTLPISTWNQVLRALLR